MGDVTLRPVIGYQGGKRRLLPRIRPYFDEPAINRYIEPFVGMGAVYLDLRARGYEGDAVLADSHPQVRGFWTMVHGDADPLIEAAEALGQQEATADRYYAMLSERVDEEAEQVARFLWLTNYAFGNSPNVYRDGQWSRTVGTKLTSAAKWGKTFPWDACIDRLRAVVYVVNDLPTIIYDDASKALADATEHDYIYADPPYANQRAYTGTNGSDFIALLTRTPGHIVLSEKPAASALLHGWEKEDGSVIARMTGDGRGADGQRGESIYFRSARHETDLCPPVTYPSASSTEEQP